MSLHCVALWGPAGAGKTTVAMHLATQWGFTAYPLADCLRAWAAQLGLPPTRGVLQALGDAARAADGPAALVHRLLPALPATGRVVIPDVRLPAEVVALRAALPACRVWVVTAPAATRAARLRARDGAALAPAEAAHPTETLAADPATWTLADTRLAADDWPTLQSLVDQLCATWLQT